MALINRLAAEYAQSHDVALRPRAENIVALENVEVEPLPVKGPGQWPKARRSPDRPAITELTHPAPFIIWPWRGAWCADPRGGPRCPTSLRSHRRPFVGRRDGIISNRDQARGRDGSCVNQNIHTLSLKPVFCGVIVCEWYVLNSDQIGNTNGPLWLRARQHHRSNAGRAESALHEAGAAKVFKEKISGAANHRAQLHRLLKTIDAGDLVIVTRLDRLARSTGTCPTFSTRSRKRARHSNRSATLGPTRLRPTAA